MAGTELPPNVVRVPRWTLALHAVQMLFAIIVLGLSAYGVHWIAYNALIFALVVCICTLGVCVYLIASQLFLHAFYNMFIALAVHAWMLLFWVVDLGLVANLARIWSGPSCYYSYYSGYYCTYYKRDLGNVFRREETTTTTAYYGALAAGAVFAAVMLVSWVFSMVILIIHVNKHRANQTTNVQNHPPPQYVANNNTQGTPMEKFGQTGAQVPVQQNYPVLGTPQQQYAQPVQQQHQQPYAPYPQDPVPRQDTVSPVSNVGGYTHPNASELGTPQHTGYNPNVSELSTPQNTGGYVNPNVSELSDRK